MASLLLLTNSMQSSAEILPSLEFLTHSTRVMAAEATALVDAPACDVVLVDGRHDLAGSRSLSRVLRATGLEGPLIVVVTEGGLAAVSADWGLDDVLLVSAGPAEVEARIRVALGKFHDSDDEFSTVEAPISAGELVVDERTYTARVKGQILDLTYKEFELLKFLAQHPGRVFTRAQLLQEVWGYDYFGGTRTVDVHVRRLRAKLGSEHENLIGTVRNVGYRFVSPHKEKEPAITEEEKSQQSSR